MDRTPVYLDSNVIIDMADGRENELLGLVMRSIYFGPYCYPYSAEQISEITDNERQARNKSRLMLLSDISRNVYFEHSINSLQFRTEPTTNVFETINKMPLTQSWEADLANFISFEQQLKARTSYGLSTDDLNNISAEEAISKINSAISEYEYGIKPGQIEPPRSLDDLMAYTEHNMREHFTPIWDFLGADVESQLRNGKLVSLFSLLDSFGFWSDSKKIYKKGSRLADSRHAFNGSYFKCVVSRDKRFLNKSEAAYKFFEITTECFHTDNFKSHLDDLMSKLS
ncbi:hypothetical protein AB8S08_00560 [Pseudidiomarina sp. PP-1MA]|uniref:DUF4935 domain-containing protein n=1 Tax=Pseudidiomarina sp. PP-1MA TaxID=3237706 RepID=A0AB39X7D2_9GAMM